MRKIALISFNDLRQALSDRGLVLLMFAAPLAVATIITVSFGSAASGAAPIDHIPLAVVNLDVGTPLGDFGEAVAEALGAQPIEPDGVGRAAERILSSPPASSGDPADIFDVINAVVVEEREVAESWLEAGTVAAVIVLPEGLSRSISGLSSERIAIEVMTRPDRGVSGDIVENIVGAIIDGMTGGVAVAQSVLVTVAGAEAVSPAAVAARDAYRELVAEMQRPPGNGIGIATDADRQGGIGFNPLVAFGATQAIFFALFTANGNATGILEEERDGTFVRLLSSSTPKAVLLGGKLVSTMVMVVVQLIILMIAFTAVGSILDGEFSLIWGTKFGRIGVVVLATSFAAAGIGAIVASAAKTPEQSGIIGTVINMFMAVTGGGFGFRLASPLRYASLVYWGSDAFEELAAGGVDIMGNVVVMLGFGMVALFSALGMFTRRFTR